MKELFFFKSLIFLLLPMLTASCEKTEKPEILILGKWNAIKVITTMYENDVQVDKWTTNFQQNENTHKYLEGGTGRIYSYGTLLVN